MSAREDGSERAEDGFGGNRISVSFCFVYEEKWVRLEFFLQRRAVRYRGPDRACASPLIEKYHSTGLESETEARERLGQKAMYFSDC